MAEPVVPSPQAPIATPDGLPSPVWVLFFTLLLTELRSLRARVAALEE